MDSVEAKMNVTDDYFVIMVPSDRAMQKGLWKLRLWAGLSRKPLDGGHV